LTEKLYHKCDEFTIPIVKFLFINLPYITEFLYWYQMDVHENKLPDIPSLHDIGIIMSEEEQNSGAPEG
jgi:hypothetical protein